MSEPPPRARLAVLAGAYAALFGLLAFSGWAANIPRLADWDGNGVATQPNTALAAVSAGLGLALVGLGRLHLAAAAVLVAGVFGAANLVQHLAGISLGIDGLFLFDRPWGRTGTIAPGRAGPPASAAFALIAIGILLAGAGPRRRRWAPTPGLLVAAIALISLVGYLFGARALYMAASLTAIALQTSTLILVLGVGLVSALPDQQPMRLLRSDSAGGALIRRALPVVIVLPIALALLLLRGETAGAYNSAMGSGLLTSLLIFFLIALLWWGARMVEERQAKQRDAEAALRAASRRKDEFLATLAHELRNPLAPIRNVLHNLRRSREPIRAGSPVHAMLERQVGSLARLVDDLTEIARITRGEVQLRRERVALGDCIAAALDANRHLVHASLSVSLPPEPIWLEGDPVRLGQVFGNLLHNAAKYTTAGDTITVAASRRDDRVIVAMRDSGAGIAPELLPRLFQMFSRGRRSATHDAGLGIGLALVRHLVGLHGGSVRAHSEGLGRGSEFIVTLPAASPSPAGTEEGRPAAPAGLAQHRILVVDDNRDAADSLGELLELAGATTRVAYDGRAALATLGEFQPTVAVLDIGLPEMDGYTVAGRLRRETPGVALIALTGWGQDRDRRRSRAVGFDHHLTKPVKPDDLLAVIASVKAPPPSIFRRLPE